MPSLHRSQFTALHAEAYHIPKTAHLTYLSTIAMAANQSVCKYIKIIAHPEKEWTIFKYNCFFSLDLTSKSWGTKPKLFPNHKYTSRFLNSFKVIFAWGKKKKKKCIDQLNLWQAKVC